MSSTPDSASLEIEKLGEALCRAIAGRRYEEAAKLVDRCRELHSYANHAAIIGVLERARRLTLMQRAMAPLLLASINSATQYASAAADRKHYLGTG